MNIKHIRTYLLVCSLIVILPPLQGPAQQNSDAAKTSVQHTPTERDGQHDFDFEIGCWKIHLKRLVGDLLFVATCARHPEEFRSAIR
jgi:hypothetical protein